MRLYPQSLFVLLLFYNVIICWVLSVFGQDFEQSFRIVAMEPERDKRAIDLGFFVRNLLMKSAYASNTKAAVSRNLINAKAATPRPTTTQRPTTTTTALAPIFNKSSFWFPFSASFGGYPLNNNVNLPGPRPGPPIGVGPRPGPPIGVGPRPLSPIGPGPRGGGGFNFDYDYIDQLRPVQQPARRRRPTTTTAAPAPATTAAPPPALPLRRRPLPKRPSHLNYDYYDDYDYGGIEQTTAAAPPPPAPPTTRSPPPPPPPQTRPRGRTRGRQQNQQAIRVPPRTGVTRLRNPLIYQYAQTNGKIPQLVSNCRNIGFSPSLCRFLYQ